ncbi:MAG: hypothetical protein WAM90_08580, partial [Rhodanobacter sp.]
MIKLLASLLMVGGLISPLASLANTSEPINKPPMIATREAAEHLAREVLDSSDLRAAVTPAGCYDVNVSTREDGVYIARITEKAGKQCLLQHEATFHPFSLEIQSANGEVDAIDLQGISRQGMPFPIQDSADMPPPDQAGFWKLEGTSRRLDDTARCSLSFDVFAFERAPGYYFVLEANRGARYMAVSYHVNDYFGGSRLTGTPHAAISLATGHGMLASYPATLKPNGEDEHATNTNGVSFNLALSEGESKKFLDALAHTTQIIPSLDSKPQDNLALTEGGFAQGFDADTNPKVAAAFRQCLTN